jgi:hypothetical protein
MARALGAVIAPFAGAVLAVMVVVQPVFAALGAEPRESQRTSLIATDP